jgi:hypothetical protein
MIILLAAVGAIGASAADAAALSPNLAIRGGGPTMTLAPGRSMNIGYGGNPAPPYYAGGAPARGGNDQSAGGSVSFNSGGSGTKPAKKPNLQ